MKVSVASVTCLPKEIKSLFVIILSFCALARAFLIAAALSRVAFVKLSVVRPDGMPFFLINPSDKSTTLPFS